MWPQKPQLPPIPFQSLAKESKYNNPFKICFPQSCRRAPLYEDLSEMHYSTDRSVRMSFIGIKQTSIRSYYTWQLGRILQQMCNLAYHVISKITCFWELRVWVHVWVLLEHPLELICTCLWRTVFKWFCLCVCVCVCVCVWLNGSKWVRAEGGWLRGQL